MGVYRNDQFDNWELWKDSCKNKHHNSEFTKISNSNAAVMMLVYILRLWLKQTYLPTPNQEFI